MSRRCVLALASLLLLAGASARAETGADALLRDLGLAPAADIVAIRATRRADGVVVVTLTPAGATKLVSDPGVTVSPVDETGRPAGASVSMTDRTTEYFTSPPLLEVHPGPASFLRVEYAYCVVAKQCLFGDATVAVPAGA